MEAAQLAKNPKYKIQIKIFELIAEIFKPTCETIFSEFISKSAIEMKIPHVRTIQCIRLDI